MGKLGLKSRQIEILTKDEIEEIHLTTLDLLEHVGVVVREEEALTILGEAGCSVNMRKKLVKFPSSLIEEAIRLAPKGFTLYARNPRNNVKVGDGVHFQPMIGRLNIIDLNGEKRRTTLRDLANLTKVADAMENYALLHSGAMMPHIEGVPDQAAHVYGYLAGVMNSEKVIKGTGRGRDKAHDCIKMASVLAGGEEEMRKNPNIFTTTNPVSPLQHDRIQMEG